MTFPSFWWFLLPLLRLLLLHVDKPRQPPGLAPVWTDGQTAIGAESCSGKAPTEASLCPRSRLLGKGSLKVL